MAGGVPPDVETFPGGVVLYSRAAQYAVRAVVHLAGEPEGTRLRIRELGSALDIPAPFLAQIFHKLARRGILRSMKGPAGGFRLGRPAREIRVSEIVEGIDGEIDLGRCVIGPHVCDARAPCPFHDRWITIREELHAALLARTLEEVSSQRSPAVALDA